jgi:hypothetical protein
MLGWVAHTQQFLGSYQSFGTVDQYRGDRQRAASVPKKGQAPRHQKKQDSGVRCVGVTGPIFEDRQGGPLSACYWGRYGI